MLASLTSLGGSGGITGGAADATSGDAFGSSDGSLTTGNKIFNIGANPNLAPVNNVMFLAAGLLALWLLTRSSGSKK